MFYDGFIGEADALLALSKIHGGLSAGNTSGQVYFVDSGDAEGADADGYGTFFNPFLTLVYALTKVAAGDTIIVKSGHTETLTTGTNMSVAGVHIIGQGRTTLRPTFTLSGTGVFIDLDEAASVLENVILTYDTATHGKAVRMSAAGCILRNCRIIPAGAINASLVVLVDNVDDCAIVGCALHLTGSTVGAAAIRLSNACHRTRIVGNTIFGNMTTAAIDAITAASNDLIIEGNRIVNTQTGNIDGIIDLVASCTGIVADNYGKHGNTTTLAGAIDAASCGAIENYIQNTDGESGGIAPPTRST